MSDKPIIFSAPMVRALLDGRLGDDGYPMQRVGKAAAGRILDGVLHDEYPAGYTRQCDGRG